jgi:CRP-like cAMP-binding protein
LNQLPKEEYHRLQHIGETVSLARGHEICRQGRPISHVYFPTSAAFCIQVLMEDGKAIDAACIGSEGMIGIAPTLGVDFSTVTAVAQVSGESLRIPTAGFLSALKSGSLLEKVVRRYVGYALRFANQSVACNLLHSVQQRMCRWLLMAQDQNGSHEELMFTQEFLAGLLGVRRQTISVVAGALRSAGFISYRRGVLRILNRQGLANASCECYQVTKGLYSRLMA